MALVQRRRGQSIKILTLVSRAVRERSGMVRELRGPDEAEVSARDRRVQVLLEYLRVVVVLRD